MSTGFECAYIKVSEQKTFVYADRTSKTLGPGWYYMLQNWTCPVGADWTDDATTYGPFKTEEDARRHLDDTQPNPGGSTTHTKPSEDFLKTVAYNLC